MAVRGGDKIRSRLTNIARVASGGKKVRIGFLRSAVYPDSTPVAMVAAVQEFGSPTMNIPSRPFMRNTISEKSSGWPATMARLLKDNDYDSFKSLDEIGEIVAEQFKETIRAGNFAPLAQSTVERKGFDTILQETGVLIDSINHEVE
jgi:hypothetical protein